MKKGAKTKKITIDKLKITIDKLAVLMEVGFSGINKKIESGFDSINRKMKTGFSRVNKKIDNVIDLVDKLAVSTLKGFESVDEKIGGMKKDIEGVKNQLEGTNKRIDNFTETKVSKITFKELDNRVGFIEKKLEIKK